MTKTKAKTRTAVIGYCGVDSGQILITDPGYLNQWTNNGYADPVPRGDYSYAGACERTLDHTTDSGQLGFFPEGFAYAGVVARTGVGDGLYPVVATIADLDGWGERITKLEIIFIDDTDLSA